MRKISELKKGDWVVVEKTGDCHQLAENCDGQSAKISRFSRVTVVSNNPARGMLYANGRSIGWVHAATERDLELFKLANEARIREACAERALHISGAILCEAAGDLLDASKRAVEFLTSIGYAHHLVTAELAAAIDKAEPKLTPGEFPSNAPQKSES